MTMTDGTALVIPSAFPTEWDPLQPLDGFRCDIWLPYPETTGPDWFSTEERARREANAYAYRQRGTKEQWYRYLLLGFFVFEDCFECDKLWENMEANPLQVHRAIWYNFRYHIDQEMPIPPLLNTWAMDVSRVYLLHFDPTTLNETDTLAYSWKTMPFMNRMEMDDQAAWIPVQRRRRSKSPPTDSLQEDQPLVSGLGSEVSKGSSSPSVAEFTSLMTTKGGQPAGKPKPQKKKSRTQVSWSQGLPPVTTVVEVDDENEEDALSNSGTNFESDSASKGTSTNMQSDKPNSYRTVPTNDGTHRVNVKWNPPESTHAYEKDKKKLHDAIYELVREIVPDTVGVLYRWESEDLVLSKIVKDMTALDLRDFISPAITFIHAQQQIVFGIRLGFRIPPGQWMRSDLIKGFIKSKTIDVSVSNSTSTSGKMVTAGYVLLKAPNTTQLTRYTQFLRSILPEQTPYFDVVRYKKTPLDQFIPHLRIQCGEKHVTPLCQALLPVLTGRGSAMFIPRYALGAMADEQIRRHFLFHEKWCKSLKAVPLSPHVNHLDQKRIEYHEDGTTLERSTREWMATILAPDQNSPALCDVVNGPPDFKAYLLVPSHYLQVVQQEWQQYKARLFPPRHREARFRDNLPGLPHVIHIQAEIEAHVSFFEKLSEASVWQLTSESSRNPSTVSAADENRYNRRIGINQQLNARSGWPTPAEVSPRQKPRDQTTRPNQQSLEDSEQHSTGGDTSIGTTDDDRSTASTRSLTHASRTSATDARFSELELQMNKKLQALDASGKASLNRLLSMEQQFHRIDDMDKKLAAVNKTLDAATKQMELSTSTHQEISSDMAELKVHTAQQFTEMNQRLLSNMECQHKMSTTLLDLRGHFEKMSAFMEGLATKMELDRTKASSAFTQASNGGVGSRSADIRGIPNDLQSTASSDSTTSGSSTSKTSVQSDASSTIYSSPEKKKQRSHEKTGLQHRMGMNDSHAFSDDLEVGQGLDYMAVCHNLDDVFSTQEDVSSPVTPRAGSITWSDAPMRSRVVSETTSGIRNTENVSDIDIRLDRAQEQWRNLFSRPLSAAVSGGTNRPESQPRSLTHRNQRENQPWGDPLVEKAGHHTRVYIQNVNGLSFDRRGGQLNNVCEVIQEVQADLFCGQEHNLDVTQLSIRSTLYDTVQQHWDRAKFIAGTTPIPFATPYKPGGTFMLTIGNLSGRIVHQVQDRWGRWVIQEFSGRSGRRVAIVSAYQPVDKRGQEGGMTVASQHRSLLLHSQDTVSNPRSAFRRDLLEALRKYKNAGAEILLVGDFNEPFGSDPDGLSFIAGELSLVNLAATRHPSMIVPATYSRGTKCLDYALGSARMRDALIALGYDPFNVRLSSDHRGFFLDFDTDKLFGNPTSDLASLKRRMLKANNTAQVTTYINKMYELLMAHNAFDRGTRLTYPGNRHQFAERLDRDVLAASLAAETAIPQFGEHAWSIELSNARRRVQQLRKCLSMLRNGLDSSTLLQEYATAFPEHETPRTQSQCSRLLRLANQEVRRIVKHSFVIRDVESRQRIQELEQSIRKSDKHTATRLRRIRKAEDIKAVMTKLRNVRGKTHRSGVVRLEIPLHSGEDPKKCTQWQQIDVPTEIVKLLQERNRLHFGQAHGTPFTISPLADLLGYTGISETQRQLLHGTFDTTGYDDSVQLLLNHLQYTHEWSVDTIRPTICDEDFCAKLRLWSESTTTSPSGMHLGHYKALIARHSFSSEAADDEVTPEFKAKRDELNYRQQAIRQLRLDLLNYALERGYSFQRWQKVVNTMLFKDPDNVRLHRTRVIHIYEADFNLFLGLKWRSAMHQAEDLRILNDGQFGSRPLRNATDPVFIEELQLEISRATRKPVILTNYDATACYDRIIPNLGMTVSQKYGVPAMVTACNAITLEKAEFHVRTELGISPSGYHHESEFPVYGTGQGSANSPAIWCFLSSTLFDCYDTRASQATYWDTNGDTSVQLGLIGFVDDCNGQTNAFDNDGSIDTVQQIASQAQSNAQCWSDLLHASGGALELSKCSNHILQWQFSMSGAPVLVPAHSAEEVSIKVWDRQEQKDQHLQVLPAYTAHKTLGHYKDPAGTQKEQFRQLQKKSDSVTAFLWETPLTRREAWTFYYACYLPSVSYPLASSSLTQRQLDCVQKKAMSIIVPRCGFNRNTKKAILYGPLAYGGANFRSLYVQQGVAQILMFVRHWRKNSITGKLLRISVSWFQAQVGVSFSILEQVHSSLPHLESKWLSSLRSFLKRINAKLRLDTQYLPELQRLHDACIMDVIQSSEIFSPSEICKLNYCRLYLNVVTLSDLTTINGRQLDMNKLVGNHDLLSSRTYGTAIYQERPSESSWKLWKRANALWSRPDGSLIQPLGDWVLPLHKMRQRHPAYWFGGRLWVKIQDQYVKCHAESHRVFRESNWARDWASLPSQAVPILATQSAPGLWKISHQSYILEVNTPPCAGTFRQFIASLPSWEMELLQHVEMSDDPFSVALALEHGLRAVSDGSDWDQIQGAFGWVMSTDVGDRCACGMGPARSASPHAYRSESYGLLSLLCFLRRLAEFTGKHDNWTGIIATDSQSLVDTVLQKNPPGVLGVTHLSQSEMAPPIKSFPLEPTIPEWDIVRGIQALLQGMPDVRLQHVKGHQDREIPYHRLSLLAQLNVDADTQASRYQRDFGSFQPTVLLTEWAGVHLEFPTGTVTSHYETALRFQATAPDLKSHMMERYSWSKHTMEVINWEAHGKALHRHLNRRTHLVKLVHGLLPTNAKIHRSDPRKRTCPSCRQCPETWQHILRCSSELRVTWRRAMLRNLERKCDELCTMPRLKRLLLKAIGDWTHHNSSDDSEFTVDMSDAPLGIRRLLHQQNAIGWDHLFLGRFSSEWSSLQDEYYARQARATETKRQTGHRWQIAIIGAIWQQWFLLWEQRNKDLHGADASAKALAERRVIDRTLIDIYDFRNQMEPSVRRLLHQDITDHFSKTVTYNKNWIAVYGPLVKMSIKRAKAKAIQGVKSIRHYFGTK